MKKRIFVSFVSLFVILALASGTALAQGGVTDRINDQQRKIMKGVRSGKLTPGEADILQANLNHIKGKYHRAKADGRLSRREIGKLHKMLDKNSYMIRKMKKSHVRRIY
ncbi:MAG: hypothetical protein AAGU11_17990 [Syntrophobacteraceae bacterium]